MDSLNFVQSDLVKKWTHWTLSDLVKNDVKVASLEIYIHILYKLQNLAVDVCRIADVYCLPAPAHPPFSSNSLNLSVPEEAYSRNVRASGTLKFGYEGVFKIFK